MKKKPWSRNPLFLYGAPFLLFMVGGTSALSYFTQMRYDRADRKNRMVR